MPPTQEVFEFGRLTQPADAWWAAFATALIVAFAVRQIWFVGPNLSRRLRAALLALRLAVFGLLGWALLDPRVRTETKASRTPAVGLAIDNSRSMARREGGPSQPTRLERVRAAFDAAQLPAKTAGASWFRFDRKTEPFDIAALPTLDPIGDETRPAEAVVDMARALAGRKIAALALVTDGRGNAGAPWETAGAARSVQAPVHALVVGAEEAPRNVRMVEASAPPRAFRGDPVKATARLEATGGWNKPIAVTVRLADRERNVTKELFRREFPVPAAGTPIVVEAAATLDVPGRYRFVFEAGAGAGEERLDDNAAEAATDVADRRTRVLLFAGGPTREYQFARNLLHRDRTMEVVVVLQTGVEGISQDAAKTLTKFPEDRTELFGFDALLAFDPDWGEVSETARRNVVDGVAEQGLGIAFVAGPLHTPTLAERFPEIAGLLPYVPRKVFADEFVRPAAETWALKPTDAGLAFAALRLSDDPATSVKHWREFPGFCVSLPAVRMKPGAASLLEFGDPRQKLAGGAALPAAATQFFGAGRSLAFGSGELWRLRRQGEGLHERLWTQVVRYVAETRLLRGSGRGGFLVEQREFPPGAPIPVRGRFLDERFQPLRVPTLPASAATAAGPRELTLVAQPGQPGFYAGTLSGAPPGEVRLQAALGAGIAVEDVLRVVESRRELDDVRADRAALSRLCRETGGRLFELNELDGFIAALAATPETTIVSGPPRPLWDRAWLALAVAGLLSVEWILRKLAKLS